MFPVSFSLRYALVPLLASLASFGILIPKAHSALPIDSIKLPPGFSISVYASPVSGARSMTLGEQGTLFVGTRSGQVYAVEDRNGDHVGDAVIVIARGLNAPNGVAFRNGSLYVAEINRILRYDDIESHLNDPPSPVVVTSLFPSDGAHGWKFIRFGPDGKLYVPVGAPCNVCARADPYASITRINPDGGGFEVFARGIRNTVGFDWNPSTNELWFTDNGRDNLGDDIPPDELNRAPQPGMHFGFPFCHGGDILDPDIVNGHSCSDFTPPEIKLGPHAAALGMRFYTGTLFPEQYRGQIFIAEHGSWNRSIPIGYRITLVRLENGKPVRYEVFAEGWLKGDNYWGRPVDVQVMPDGALLVSDDTAGAIYRITYQIPIGIQEISARFVMSSPFPNPFNSQVAVRYELPVDSAISLTVYDVLGRKIAVLSQGWMEKGTHETVWNGTATDGSPVASGIYLLRLDAGKRTAMKKIAVLR